MFVKRLETSSEIYSFAERIPNLALYGPKSAVIGGVLGDWDERDETFSSTYWANRGEEKVFTLGDFSQLVNFLLEISGRKTQMETEIEKAVEQSVPNPLSGETGTES